MEAVEVDGAGDEDELVTARFGRAVETAVRASEDATRQVAAMARRCSAPKIAR